MKHPQKTVAILCLLAALCIGCGGAESYVKGRITLDGNVLTNANATFFPVAGGGSAYGKTDKEGNYFLQTGSQEGLASGEYRVVVVGREPLAEDWPRGEMPPIAKRITPDRYARPETTELLIEINPGKNEIDLALTTEPES